MPKKQTIAVAMQLVHPYKRHFEAFAGIQEYAKSHTNWTIEHDDYPEEIIAEGAHYDAIIGRPSKECISAAQKARLPLVTCLESKNAHSVHTDLYAIGKMTAEHLIARGLKRFASIGAGGGLAEKLYYQGIHEVAQAHGYPCFRHRVNLNYDLSRQGEFQFRKQIKQFQRKWEAPIGVGCIDDSVCRSAAGVCQRLGWIIPEELSIIGAGNDDMICTRIEPTLTSIDENEYQRGYQAARLLDRLLQGETIAMEPIIISPKALIVRQSSDAFAVNDPQLVKALRYMANHSSEHITVPMIAQAAGIGRRSLEYRFNKKAGRSIIDELTRMRVETMKRLLVQGDEPLKIISTQVGFGSTENMHIMFKRITGMTPTRYRKQHTPRTY